MSPHSFNYVPTSIVIFGGTGDLAKTKLLPALYHLYQHKMLPEQFRVIGLSRKDLSDDEYRTYAFEALESHLAEGGDSRSEFVKHLYYASGSFDDQEAYETIKQHLTTFDNEIKQCTSKLFYLAVPPTLYGDIFSHLKESEAMSLCDGVGSWSRLLVEKPFGHDSDTARALEEQLQSLFSEDQIYRIDHYLAKDAIENIISLRFANSILADSWNGDQIESINIKLFENKDVSNRGAFYDGLGALRDVGQNHMLQILALLTMGQTDVHSPEQMRATRLEATRALLRLSSDALVRAQYKGFRETDGVSPESDTETYFKIETHIDNNEWKDVPIILESGKALPEAKAEAVITFKPVDLCHCYPDEQGNSYRNQLRITFSPKEKIELTMWVKEPGFGFKLHERQLVLDEHTGEAFRSPEAYERVLHDCIVGDQTRFVSGDEVQAAWEFITPILEEFKNLPLHEYEPGTEVRIDE